jgi:hypothetical protein
MKKISSKKLVLNRDTVRDLTNEELAGVAGGTGVRSRTATCGTADDLCLCRICTWR